MIQAEAIRSLADLRPGDIGIMTMGGFVPGFFPVRIGQLFCKESFTIGPFSADHVIICVEAGERSIFLAGDAIPGKAPRAVQAMPRGAEEITLTPAKHWTDGVAWFRLTEDYPGQAVDAAAIARLFVSEKVGYSFSSYPAIAAWSRGMKIKSLEKWIGRRGPVLPAFKRQGPWPGQLYTPQLPVRAICSGLVDQAWSLAGKEVISGVKPLCVTPGKLAIELSRRCKAYGPEFLS